MAQSVATLKYGTYEFSPIPQVGTRDNVRHIGQAGFGPGTIERSVGVKGKIWGSNLNDVETKIAALRAAMAKEGQTLYWKDGTTVRINNVAQVLSLDIPEEWNQYEADYTIKFLYYPLNETHYNPVGTVKYGDYVFDPIPAFGREFNVQRESADAVNRESAKVRVTLQGFIDEGSLSANYTELNTLIAALSADDVLQYGSFTQAVRVTGFTHPADIGDTTIPYTISLEYDAYVSGVDGVIKMSSSRAIDCGERVVTTYVPFKDDPTIQRLGRTAQRITASGYVTADSMAHARTAAQAEIDANFPANGIEERRQITEKANENRVEWNVTKVYRTPPLTGGVYGAGAVF